MKHLLLLVSILLATAACSAEKSTSEVEISLNESIIESIKPDEFKKIIDSQSAVLLDVRTPAEVAQGHIAGALNINLQGDEFRQKISELDPEKPVLVYCSAGKRSQAAAEIMEELGFSKVYNLENGLGTWTGAGYALVE